MTLWILLLCILGTSVPALAEPASRDLVLSIQDGRLSVNTNQMPLAQVLEAAAQKLSVTVHLEPALAKNSVSVTFLDLPLTQAFDRLLEGTNYVLTREHLYVWSREETSESRPLDASRFIVVAGSDRPSQTTESWENLRQEALHAPDSDARLTALDSLMDRSEGLEVLPTLTAALHDADPMVRTYALESLMDRSEGLEVLPTLTMALRDADPMIRTYALESLSEVTEPIAIDHFIEVAQSDGDPDIRMMALELLAERDPEKAERLHDQVLREGDEFEVE